MDTPMSLYHKSYHGARSVDVFRSLSRFRHNMRSGHGKDVGLLRYRYPLPYLLPAHVYSALDGIHGAHGPPSKSVYQELLQV